MNPDRLKNIRIESGKTQQELAKELGISLSALGNYERGDRTPDADFLVSMAKLFGITSDYILGLSDSPRPEKPWPSATPVVAVEAVEHIKDAVEEMLSSAVTTSYGADVFKAYALIFQILVEINEFVEKKLFELQLSYPSFRGFGDELNVTFDGMSLMSALVANNSNAIEFAEKVDSALISIDDKILETSRRIHYILTKIVTEAIRGKPIDLTEVSDAIGDPCLSKAFELSVLEYNELLEDNKDDMTLPDKKRLPTELRQVLTLQKELGELGILQHDGAGIGVIIDFLRRNADLLKARISSSKMMPDANDEQWHSFLQGRETARELRSKTDEEER